MPLLIFKQQGFCLNSQAPRLLQRHLEPPFLHLSHPSQLPSILVILVSSLHQRHPRPRPGRPPFYIYVVAPILHPPSFLQKQLIHVSKPRSWQNPSHLTSTRRPTSPFLRIITTLSKLGDFLVSSIAVTECDWSTYTSNWRKEVPMAVAPGQIDYPNL